MCGVAYSCSYVLLVSSDHARLAMVWNGLACPCPRSRMYTIFCVRNSATGTKVAKPRLRGLKRSMSPWVLIRRRRFDQDQDCLPDTISFTVHCHSLGAAISPLVIAKHSGFILKTLLQLLKDICYNFLNADQIRFLWQKSANGLVPPWFAVSYYY